MLKELSKHRIGRKAKKKFPNVSLDDDPIHFNCTFIESYLYSIY